MATLRATGTATVVVGAGAADGHQFVQVPGGITMDQQVLLTSRVTHGKAAPDGLGPLFVPFTNYLPGNHGFDIWVVALDQQAVPHGANVDVDWAVFDP